MVVVSDASPIRALHHLGLLSLCTDLYGQVIVPEAVRKELSARDEHLCGDRRSEYPEFIVRSAGSEPDDLGVPDDLDAGETEAIVLALELRADLLLMDERKGTEAARTLGLATIGVIGVLLEGKRKKRIDQIMPLVDRLVADIRFHISLRLRTRVAEIAGEL